MRETYSSMLEEVARLFDQRAKMAEKQSEQTTVLKHAALYNREATVWQTAAVILRDTNFDDRPALKVSDDSDALLMKLCRKAPGRDPSKYIAMITFAEANEAASRLVRNDSLIADLMSRIEADQSSPRTVGGFTRENTR